ncbi:MAG: hypothetical protein L0Y42_02865 [Phycisphaerales bacterium]|nr:hypothetical protein [Phycisphaerales bacterium]
MVKRRGSLVRGASLNSQDSRPDLPKRFILATMHSWDRWLLFCPAVGQGVELEAIAEDCHTADFLLAG